jgi:hypothetical protein
MKTAVLTTAESAAETPMTASAESVLTTIKIPVSESVVKIAAAPIPPGTKGIISIAVIIIVGISIGVRIPVVITGVTRITCAPVQTESRKQNKNEESSHTHIFLRKVYFSDINQQFNHEMANWY